VLLFLFLYPTSTTFISFHAVHFIFMLMTLCSFPIEVTSHISFLSQHIERTRSGDYLVSREISFPFEIIILLRFINARFG
jgi:hypothetical protein